jgi:hypothetical protein
MLEYSGTLLHAAEARCKAIDSEGHLVPVLCMHLELDNAARTRMHVEQLFPQGHETQCQAAARRHRKGERVAVQALLIHTRLAVTASHIHVIQKDVDR